MTVAATRSMASNKQFVLQDLKADKSRRTLAPPAVCL